MLKQILFSLLVLLSTHVYSQSLTKEQMHADLAILQSAWQNLHPGLYRYNTPDQIEGLFREARQKTSSPLSQRTFYILLSQLNIKLRCGHTFVSPFNQKQVIEESLFSKAFFPLLFRVIDRKLIVTHDLTEVNNIQVGSEILSINGIRSKTIIDSLLTVSKSDGNNGLNKALDNICLYPQEISTKKYTLFDVYFPLFFKQNIHEPSYLVTVKDSKGSTKTFTVNGLTKEARQQAYDRRYGVLPSLDKSWYTKEINNETVVFRLGDFAVYNWKFDFKKYLDSVFLNLILDIRQNEGGSDEARNEVLTYIISKPIQCFNRTRRLYKYLQVPDSLLPYLSTWDPAFKKPKNPAEYLLTAEGLYESKSKGASCDTLIPKKNRFTGKVFLITDVTNSSTTFIMADNFKREKLGISVGEETGGTQQGINGGQIFFLYLPNSKIEMDLPLIYQTPPDPRKDEGIIPHYIVKTTPKDITNGHDPQLYFIVNRLVKKERELKAKTISK
jgi:hypothetical protein